MFSGRAGAATERVPVPRMSCCIPCHECGKGLGWDPVCDCSKLYLGQGWKGNTKESQEASKNDPPGTSGLWRRSLGCEMIAVHQWCVISQSKEKPIYNDQKSSGMMMLFSFTANNTLEGRYGSEFALHKGKPNQTKQGKRSTGHLIKDSS